MLVLRQGPDQRGPTKWWIALLDLLLYGQFWISAAAWVLLAQSCLLLTDRWPSGYLGGFLFCGALGVYALHRLVGLGRNEEEEQAGYRHVVVRRYRRHVIAYAGVGFMLSAWCFLHLPAAVRLAVLLPALLALAYVLPLPGGKRLRDYAYIKIFLLTLVWAWLTVMTPAIGAGLSATWPAWLMTAERACFIFAIAITFDIRDIAADRALGVATLPSRFGVQTARRLAGGALLLMLLLAGLNHAIGTYSVGVLLAMGVSAAFTGLLVGLADADRHDYFFTGLVDGMMVVQGVLVWLGC